MSDNKVNGEESELAFCLRAIQLGLRVSKPIGDSSKYDAVVDNGSTLYRIQVKSATHERANGAYGVVIKCGNHSRKYSVSEADFIAAHIRPLSIWYIIPMEIAAKVSGIRLRPLADNISRYAQYEEAWHLLNK